MIRIRRRDFLRQSGAAGVGLWLAPGLSPNEKLNIACIGAGGKGKDDIRGVSSETIVALCDVDDRNAADMFNAHPKAAKYKDFRVMLEKEKGIDAVVISAPDHIHAPAAAMAIRMGKHVYVQKPLTHSIHEVRVLGKLAAEHKVATQMGNQGHAFDPQRQMVEVVRSGVLGEVREVHAWTDRPWWPQGIERPSQGEPVPQGLDWDLWLGPAPERPYHSAYVPFKWRGWWDFGTGALGDMACHIMDGAYWSLKLGLPTAVEAEAPPPHAETGPRWSVVRFEFPEREGLPPVKLTWYDGGRKPPAELAGIPELPKNGSILVGSKGTLYMQDLYASAGYHLLPKEKFEGYHPPEPTLPRAGDPYHEWIAACKGGAPTLGGFEYAVPFTEAVLTGVLALRTGKRIEWDAEAMKAKGCPEADAFIRREYRKGWSL